MNTRPRILVVLSAVAAVGLTGCGKKDATIDAPPPPSGDARPDAAPVNKAANPRAPGAAQPSLGQVK